MSLRWLYGAMLVLMAVTGLMARGKGSLALAIAFPVVALLAGIGNRAWEASRRDLDADIAKDVAELTRQYAAAVKATYHPDLAKQLATQLDALYRGLAENRGVAHDPKVTAELTHAAFTFWAGQALVQAAGRHDVISAKMALEHDLFRKQIAEHRVEYYLAPFRELFAIVVSGPLTSLALLLGGIGLGGLTGLGLAELYFTGNVFLKVLAGMLALTAMWVWFPAMKFFGLCDLRGWLAMVSYAGAVVAISLVAEARLHWPGWGGPLVGALYVLAGLVIRPPNVFGVADNPYPHPYPTPPTLNPPGVGMFPPLPPH